MNKLSCLEDLIPKPLGFGVNFQLKQSGLFISRKMKLKKKKKPVLKDLAARNAARYKNDKAL